MKILDLQTGRIHEYGENVHDSLYVSSDGRYLTYYNLQNGDGSGLGDYRFVCDDNKIPSESKTAEALHADVYFNIGGWNAPPKGEWIEESSETGALGIKYTWVRCNQCGWVNSLVIPKNFCPNCGADMRKGGADE